MAFTLTGTRQPREAGGYMLTACFYEAKPATYRGGGTYQRGYINILYTSVSSEQNKKKVPEQQAHVFTGFVKNNVIIT